MAKTLLFPPTVARLRETKMTGEHLVTMFETMAAQASATEEPEAIVCVYYLDETDVPVPGQFVPELYFVVRKAADPGDVS